MTRTIFGVTETIMLVSLTPGGRPSSRPEAVAASAGRAAPAGRAGRPRRTAGRAAQAAPRYGGVNCTLGWTERGAQAIAATRSSTATVLAMCFGIPSSFGE